MAELTHTILCVDDDVGILDALNRLLCQTGYRVFTAESAKRGLDILNTEPVNLIIANPKMPDMQEHEFLRQSRAIRPDAIRVILLASGDVNDAISALTPDGICKLIVKPWNDEQLLASIADELQRHHSESQLQEYERNKEYAIILGLAKLAEFRDPETEDHLFRVENYTRILAQQLATMEKYAGSLTPDWIENLARSSVLHDIGKVGIPDAILLKPGPLTPEEWEVMQSHCTIGGATLASAEWVLDIDGGTFLSVGRDIAYYHHEGYDGQGYPFGLAGDDIPLAARIVALADGYDAMRSKRPYKDALPHDTVKQMILDERCKRYHPDVVDAFIHRESDFCGIHDDFVDEDL